MPRTLEAYSPKDEKIRGDDGAELTASTEKEKAGSSSSMNSGAWSLQDLLQGTVTGEGIVERPDLTLMYSETEGKITGVFCLRGPLISGLGARWFLECEGAICSLGKREDRGGILQNSKMCPNRRHRRQRKLFLQTGLEWAGDRQMEHNCSNDPWLEMRHLESGIGPKIPTSKYETVIRLTGLFIPPSK
jgi:hypothetical protein